jgi:arylsulfatase A-like enzyme
MPTLLTLCGLTVPATVEGLDLSGMLDGKDAPERTGVLIANYHPFADWRTARGGRAYRGIRTETHTFVRDHNGPWLLFDNDADPYQLQNLVNRKAAATIQGELDAGLQALLMAQDDSFETPEQLRERWGYTIDDAEEIPYAW